MKPSPIEREELHDLAAQYCAGTLDDADAQRLADTLRESPGARRWYIEYLDLHSALAWECSSAADGERTIAPQPAAEARRAPRALRVLRHLLATPQRVALSVATVVIAVCLVAMALTPARVYRVIGWHDQDRAAEVVLAARLTGAVDCRWKDGKSAATVNLPRGSNLLAGRLLELVSGTAELTFVNGTVVTLTGPATLLIQSPTSGRLTEGKMWAHVPPAGAGFTMHTPGATVVDLGTEFGLLVPPRDEASGQPLGKEELHVFQGMVEIKFNNTALPKRRLLANEAVRFASNPQAQTEDGGYERLASSLRTKFPRTVDANQTLTVAAPLANEKHPPVTRGLILWLAADGAMHCTSDGAVVAWQDMLAGENRQAQSAQQFFPLRRPEWVADAFHGRPAVRFDGDDYLALVAADKLGVSGQSYEMYFVARSTSPEIQFLIGGGTEEFEVHLNGVSGARFIPTGYFDGAGASDWGAPNDFSDGRPHLVSARILPEQNFHGVLEIDGHVSSDLTADDARGYSELALRLGMRHDGSYGLRGEIAEVLVFSKSLTAKEQAEIRRYLADKYSLPID